MLAGARAVPASGAVAERSAPRRGLLYCMEYLEENLDDWLGEELAARALRAAARAGCTLGPQLLGWRLLHVLVDLDPPGWSPGVQAAVVCKRH